MRPLTRTVGTLAVALLTLGALGCADAVGPDMTDDLSPSFGKGGKPGKPGDGGDSGPSAGNVATAFAATSLVQSNDGQPLMTIKKKQEVTSEVTNDGRQWLDVNPGSANRSVCVTFPADGSIVSQSDWDVFSTQSGVVLGVTDTYCGKATMHTRDHTNPDKLLGMDPDTAPVHMSGGKLVLDDLGPGDEWEWRLMFDDYRIGGNRQHGVCIGYDVDGVWTIANDASLDDDFGTGTECDPVDTNVNLMRVQNIDGSAVFTLVAQFDMPFRYTLTP